MRDFRKGGLNPNNFTDFMRTVRNLPPYQIRTPGHLLVFDKFQLSDISESDFSAIMQEIMKRGIKESKKCWHPEASSSTCDLDGSGNIKVSGAHSIQNNGILSKIVDNGHVMGYALNKGEFDGEQIGRHHASIFWGFCNKHDKTFEPIEIEPYKGTDEQHFLFAYRGFVVSAHKKLEVSNWMNYGEQSDNDIIQNKKIFDVAIHNRNYSIIESEVFEFPKFYPIAAASSFYLDFDFECNPIPHSDERMEDVFITLLPTSNKTYFILSYFKQDAHLYGNLGHQLRMRNDLESDVTMLIAAHTENVFFNPLYYNTFIRQYEEVLEMIMFQSQMDFATINESDELKIEFSFTPSNYLRNPYGINFFGY